MASLRLAGLGTGLFGPVDLTIAAGELVCLSGPSGAGKSLLLRAIADLDPSQGEVYLDAQPRASLPPTQWRTRVGLLPAEPGWWADRVGSHFDLPGRSDAPVLADLLEQLGFGPEVHDWAVARLSTGERQRLALARMLRLAPQVLLLDEATANLDPESRTRVEALLGAYRRERGAATLWVSHDPAQRARLGGRQLCIADGRLLSEA